ncbi:MAG: (Fe-S)-binding protein [Candidatus Hydrogenedentota bacterium]
MTNNTPRISTQFFADRCDLCGECLHLCPVLAWPREKAQREFTRLVNGGASNVLTQCTGCMACNVLCPQDARPHALILERWRARYLDKGIPVGGRYILPYQEPNLFTATMARLPEDERALVDGWRSNWQEPPKAGAMVYAGCNMLLQPFLLDSPVFDGIPVFGATELCCGEPLYRMGCRDEVRAVALHLQEEFARMHFSQLIMPCLAGYHLFKYVYKEAFGIQFDFEVIAMVDWLRDRIDSGALPVTPLNMSAVIHDSCWPKVAGDLFFDAVRELLAMLGVSVVEPAHTRETALCCGMCAPAARFSLLDALKAARTRLRELQEAGADLIIDYCGGCSWLFYLAARTMPTRQAPPIYHLLEVVQMAAGETPAHRTQERAADVVSAMAWKILSTYYLPGRFHIDTIAGRPVERA